MTQYEMTENLSVKCDVTLEEAKAALEASDWNTLTATHLLEQEKFRRMQVIDEAVSSGTAAAVQTAPEEAATAEAAATEAVTEKAAAAEATEINAAAADKAAAEKAAANKATADKVKKCRGEGLRNLGNHIRRLVACGNRNSLVVRKGDEKILELPVTVLALLMLCAFWVCVPLLVIGLFAGCKYSFSGRELGRENINRALNKAAEAADHVKETVAAKA